LKRCFRNLTRKTGSVTCWAPTSLLGQEILQDTTTAIKAGRSRISTEYALAERTDAEDNSLALQDRSDSYLAVDDSSATDFVTPETSLGGYDSNDTSMTEMPRSTPPGGTPAGKTLQIRHSDSLDGSSFEDSSEDSEDETKPTRKDRHRAKVASLSFPRAASGEFGNGGTALGLDNRDNVERGLVEEADFLTTGTAGGATRTADQAGAILGIANV
jgi:hypothetical protein